MILAGVVLLILVIVTTPRDESAQAKIEQGVAAYNSGNLEAAKRLYQEALLLEPENVVARFNLGVSSYQEGDVDRAERIFREVIELNPTFAPARFNLAILLERLGDLEGAEREYRNLIEVHPGHGPGRINLGFLLIDRLDRRAEGLEEFREAVEVDAALLGRIPADLRSELEEN